jgi:bacteriocin-like protein
MRELTEAELKEVSGGKIVAENRGGQTPEGNALGVPRKNPAGHEPPGQQPSPGNN